jgi:hypothetical protein
METLLVYPIIARLVLTNQRPIGVIGEEKNLFPSKYPLTFLFNYRNIISGVIDLPERDEKKFLTNWNIYDIIFS